MDWAKTTEERNDKKLRFGIWCDLYYRFDGTCWWTRNMRLWYWFSVAGFTVACVSSVKHGSQFKEIIIKSLRDLLSVCWLDAVEMVVRNFFWPFRKMGLFGFIFGLIYWPLVMPLCIITCLCYCIPLLFVSGRLLTHALKLSSQDDTRKSNVLPGEGCH